MIIRFSILILVSFIFSSSNYSDLSNKDFITGEDGIIRMYVNVIGHVKSPGSYMVHDKIDLMSVLSVAGGYLQGANLKQISIYKQDGSMKKINLNKILNDEKISFNQIILDPNDTIYIKQKSMSRFFMSSNLPSMILSLVNLAITLKNTE